METIRTATMDDLEKITQVEAECFPQAEAATKESFEGRLTFYANHFWVLEKDGEMISFVNGMTTNEKDLTDEMYEHAEMHDEQGAWQMIFGVDTRPEFRNQGNAGKVLQYVIDAARTDGRKGLVLTCKERLVPYYAKFGFQNEGKSESVHGGVVWYQMRLTFS